MLEIDRYNYWLLKCIEIKIHACTPSKEIKHAVGLETKIKLIWEVILNQNELIISIKSKVISVEYDW